MKLTGQCLEDFEKWGIESDMFRNLLGKTNFITEEGVLIDFYKLPESMQWGVYQDFFNSEEIYITLVNDFEFVSVEINREKVYEGNLFLEARTKAIEKANEIYNQ